MKRPIIIFLWLAGFSLISPAQEIITGLYENPVIITEYQRLQQEADTRLQPTGTAGEAVKLPFFDDFNQAWIYPNSRLWADNEAYVNTNFGYRSVNIGVATLDAIDSRGKLHANASQFPFLADSLTSQPIRLDSVISPSPRRITVADSIYLSFFYQPQGRGNPPEGHDSLILQFGYYTGNLIFANYYDSIWIPMSQYIQPGDTVFPGDTIYAPQDICAKGLFVIATEYFFYEDLIQMPCDSVFIPEFRWQRIWSSRGMSLQEFYDTYGTYCRQVMIPITDSVKYYTAEFRFRFINYASLASDFNPSWRSNCDQWNIDYVYLNIGRSRKDTVYRHVTFAERAPSMLKSYEAMPYRQYVNDPTNEMKSQLEMFITNLDSTIFNSSYYYAVYQVDGPFQYLYPGGNCNLFPFYINGYQNCNACAAHACPPVNFLFPLGTADSAEFEIRHFIIGDLTAQDTVGDTLRFRQKFHNYYAYDDGTPEMGYGLTPAGAKLAYRFELNARDTLRAVQMFFNRTQNNANEEFFHLMVWQDNNGKPGNVIYQQPNMKVEFSQELLGFHTYVLDEPLPLSGIFYIGWEQLTGNNLNLGYDRYNNARQNTYYNTSGEWFESTFDGALMMRPLLGNKLQPSSTGEPIHKASAITPYPNPLHGSRINFRCTGEYDDNRKTERFSITLLNMLGEEILFAPFRSSIDTGPISPGVYILRIKDEKGYIISVSKLIKH